MDPMEFLDAIANADCCSNAHCNGCQEPETCTANSDCVWQRDTCFSGVQYTAAFASGDVDSWTGHATDGRALSACIQPNNEGGSGNMILVSASQTACTTAALSLT